MNDRDRKLLVGIQGIAKSGATLNPKNPSDLKTKLIYHEALRAVCGHLDRAISYHGFGEESLATKSLEAAAQTIEIAARNALKAEGRDH